MKTFQVLPTDSRFQDLTTEQWQFIYTQYDLDNPDPQTMSSGEETEDEDGTVHEKYHDPDFENEVWNAPDDEESDDMEETTTSISQNPQNPVTEGEPLHEKADEIDINDHTQWEEV